MSVYFCGFMELFRGISVRNNILFSVQTKRLLSPERERQVLILALPSNLQVSVSLWENGIELTVRPNSQWA